MQLSLVEFLDCKYKTKCGGCPWGEREWNEHLQGKLAPVADLGVLPEMRFTPKGRVRDRADLVWDEGRLGLYARESREVLDLESCPMMTESLEAWFKEFREKAPPIHRGSVRLRVSPSGKRGVWLDFANKDVQTLFAEKEYLEWLSSKAFVEIGQRRKALVWREGAPKLTDPVLNPWFETYGEGDRPLPLLGPVGGFTQAGFAANRALVSTVAELAEKSGVKDWLELFSGNGNFSLALADRGYAVEAVELDELAIEGFTESARALKNPPKISRGDVYLKTGQLPPLAGRGLLVDPPRAGLRELLKQLESTSGEKPAAIIYVSCFSESFVSDAGRLKELGFSLQNLLGVDQFPFSPHNEWIALFRPA